MERGGAQKDKRMREKWPGRIKKSGLAFVQAPFTAVAVESNPVCQIKRLSFLR